MHNITFIIYKQHIITVYSLPNLIDHLQRLLFYEILNLAKTQISIIMFSDYHDYIFFDRNNTFAVPCMKQIFKCFIYNVYNISLYYHISLNPDYKYCCSIICHCTENKASVRKVSS